MKYSVNRFLVMLMSNAEILLEQEEQHAMMSQFHNDFYGQG